MNIPDWYWHKGLHDAIIKEIIYKDLDYDFTLRKPIRNVVEILLDAKSAMFDMTIDSIKLYNAKIISGDINCAGSWWVTDKLEMNNGKYILSILVANKKAENKIQVQFELAEIIRNR